MRKRASGEASELEAHVAGLSPGTTIRVNCPKCGSLDRTLSLSKNEDGTAVWQCFRASCGFRGAKRDGRPPLVVAASAPKKRVPFKGELSELTDEQAAFLARRVHFDERDLQVSRVMFAPERGRYAYPVMSPIGRRVGWLLRSYQEGVTPKADSKPDSDDAIMASFYFCDAPDLGDVVVAVEDIPSAVRVSRHINAVALMGNGAGAEVVSYIKSRFTRITYAMDKDAYSNSVRMARDTALRFKKTSAFYIEQDFKDMDDKTLTETCSAIRATYR